MNAGDLHAEFRPSAGQSGQLPVYDDRTALTFVDRARQAGLAISAVEMLRADELGSVEPPAARILGAAERMSSWDEARSSAATMTRAPTSVPSSGGADSHGIRPSLDPATSCLEIS